MADNWINSRLETLGMTKADLARKARISPSYVSDLVSGRRGQRMGADVAQRISKALKVKPIFLLETFANAKKSGDDVRKSEMG